MQQKGSFLSPKTRVSVAAPIHKEIQLQRAIGNMGVLRAAESNNAHPLLQCKTNRSRDLNHGSFFTPSVRQTLSGNGRPLDPGTRQEAEQRFGHDFSSVRIYSGANAARSTHDIGAAAYTHGNKIVFGPGYYQPNTSAGKHLLAHELAHVIQQRRAGTQSPSPARNSSLERNADNAASCYSSTSGPVNVQGSAAIGVSRTPRSLNRSLIPGMMRDDELQTEITEIQLWLLMNPASSTTRTDLQNALATLQAEANNRITSTTSGTVAHTGTIGSGASRGTIEARTNETVTSGGGASLGNLIAISYSGANAQSARWLQFVWFEMTAVTPAGSVHVAGNMPIAGQAPKPFTTTPATPNWSIDSVSQSTPFYIYAGGVGIRNATTQAMFDRPGGASTAGLFGQVLGRLPSATSATFTAHFSTYLVINNVVKYVVPWTAATTATVSGTGAGRTATIAANVVYTVGAAASANSLPANLRSILHSSYSAFNSIR